MPDLTQLALYFAAALVLAVTPGPGIFYVAARTLAGGRAEGVVSSFGTGLGGMVHVLAGSLGVSAIVLASAELFTALKLIGAAYLVWIGLRTIQSARREAVTTAERRIVPVLLKGLSAFPITPADASGQVDVSALRRLVARLCEAGVDSIGLLGSTGSTPTFRAPSAAEPWTPP